MISVQNAFDIVFDSMLSKSFFLESKTVSMQDSLHHYLAEDILADRDQPPFDRVAMDGIALSYRDQENHEFEIEGIAPAGMEQVELKNQKNCIEVMTGAILPKNSQVVLPYEQIQIESNKAIRLNSQYLPSYKNVHLQGSDYKKGQVLLNKFTKIRPTDLAILATVGATQVKVISFPSVAIIATGEELVDPSQVPLDHQIRASNAFGIKGELKDFGMENIDIHLVKDNQESIKKCISDALHKHKIILLVGGVSKGKFDFVPDVLCSLGVERVFHKVAQRPGKPLWFGIGKENQIVFGLPGNPVSCLFTVRRYLIEAYLKFLGKRNFSFSIDCDFKKPSEMTLFLPVEQVQGPQHIKWQIINTNGSGDFYSIRSSMGFIEINSAEGAYPFYPWGKNADHR